MVSLSDGLPVVVSFLGAVCLCRMVCHSSSGEPVGCAACGMVCLWLSVPSVLGVCVGWSACGIGCRGQYPRHIASGEGVPGLCVDGLPVAAGMCCLWVWIGGRGLCWCGMCCLCRGQYPRHIASGEGVGCAACGLVAARCAACGLVATRCAACGCGLVAVVSVG